MKRVAVVTGGNKGIGFAITRALCKQFDGEVILTARNPSLGQSAVVSLEGEGLNPKFHQLDITDHDSILRLRDFLSEHYEGLDVLVNNAGIAFDVHSTTPFSEQAEITVKTNYAATLDICEVLFPLLRPHARVCNVSSGACLATFRRLATPLQETVTSDDVTVDELTNMLQQFVEAAKSGECQDRGFPQSAYGMSKLGVTVLSRIQQRELDKGRGVDEDILINACCPGQVATDMSNNKGKLTIDEGAITPVYCALLPSSSNSPRGKFLSEKQIQEFSTATP